MKRIRLGLKALMCLRVAECRHDEQKDVAADAIYARACQEFSEKAVLAKFQELVDRGYLDCGVTARSGWLTEKGREVLRQIEVDSCG